MCFFLVFESIHGCFPCSLLSVRKKNSMTGEKKIVSMCQNGTPSSLWSWSSTSQKPTSKGSKLFLVVENGEGDPRDEERRNSSNRSRKCWEGNLASYHQLTLCSFALMFYENLLLCSSSRCICGTQVDCLLSLSYAETWGKEALSSSLAHYHLVIKQPIVKK